MRNRVAEDTRGATEIIGFVLVFSLVVGTIAMVYVGGLSALDESREAERVTNAERAFDVMANNFQQMGRGKAPNRATEIKLAEAQLATVDAQRFISINTSSMDTGAKATSVPIRYSAGGDTSIVYENGAIIRVDRNGAVMKKDPDFLFSDEVVVVRYIALRGSGQAVGGSTVALVRAERQDDGVIEDRGASTNVTVKIRTHPDRADVWEDYFRSEVEEEMGTTPTCSQSTVNSDTVEVTCYGFDANDRVTVSYVAIRVTLA